MQYTFNKDQFPTVFSNTQKFVSKLNNLSPNSPHPQQILMHFLNHNFSSQQCYDQVSSQSKKEKLQSEINKLRQKISSIIKENQKVISLLQLRDEKTIILQKLLKQRNSIDVKAQLDQFRTKHQFKDNLLKGLKHSIIPQKRVTVKDNLRFYKVANKEFRQKITQLKHKSQKLQRQNQILFEQKQIEEKVSLINCTDMRQSTNQQLSPIKQFLYKNSSNVCTNVIGFSDSNIWIKKIEQLKKRHLSPQKQCQKQQIYQSARALNSSPLKIPNFNQNQNQNNINSSRFWSFTFRNQSHQSKDKENTFKRSLSRESSTNPGNRSINCCKSNERLSFIHGNQSQRSLSRVKSQGRLNQTSRTNLYTYRKIYQ